MRAAGGRAQGGYGIADAHLSERDDVHVAFNNEQARELVGGLARLIKAIELGALVENRRLWGVEIFGFVVSQNAATETDSPAAGVANGEHNAVAEAVVAAIAAAPARLTGFAFDNHAAFEQVFFLLRGGGAGLEQVVPARRCVAKAEVAGDSATETAAF